MLCVTLKVLLSTLTLEAKVQAHKLYTSSLSFLLEGNGLISKLIDLLHVFYVWLLEFLSIGDVVTQGVHFASAGNGSNQGGAHCTSLPPLGSKETANVFGTQRCHFPALWFLALAQC